MSIFKSTLDPVTAAQLAARQKVISPFHNLSVDGRDDVFLRYTTGKNSWVRMTSFVNYYGKDDLSKKYILEGGTLYNKGDNEFALRSGVGKQSGAYASNLDINDIAGKKEIVRPFGLRPMPGIAQASVVNKSAYGSLREATVEFYAWDKHQLEELELLFMRPGYTVFLEWGWSEYLDHDIPAINESPEIKGIKNFDILTLNPFQKDLTDEKIYNQIEADTKKAKGNYDAMLGYIKNFSWQLLPNGGFQCTTVLISRGEVLDSLKASTTTNFSFSNTNAQSPEQLVATMFENQLLTIIGSINDAAYSQTSYTPGLSTATPGELYNTITSANPTATQAQLQQIAIDLRVEADRKFTILNDEIKKQYPDIDLNKETFVKYCDGKDEGTAIEYISMDAFIALLNVFLIPYQENKNKKTNIAKILIPGDTSCLASEDSVSIDPTTCLIKNPKATFIADNTKGFDPFVKNTQTVYSGGYSSGTSDPQKLKDFLKLGSTNLGSIGNIYISINKILTIFRQEASNSDGITVLTLIQKILDIVSFSLGGLNDFKIHSKKSEAQIIDIHYLEGGNVRNKYEFNLIGLNSICRDVKINSRIFAEQSTMIGIGAAAGSINNLGDIYTSTQQQFNKGLTDRILNNIHYTSRNVTVGAKNLVGDQAYYYTIFKTLEGLKKYVTDKVLGIPNGVLQYTIVPTSSEIANAGNALKTIHYQLNGKDVDFKALIPFELEITLDGIGGFVVGQIFTINNNILPRDYYNKNLGFIITGINHKLANNDWTTELKTQICLLDTQEELQAIGKKQNEVKDIIKTLNNQAQTNSYLVNALSDFLVYQTVKYIFAYDGVNTIYIQGHNTTDFTSLKTSIIAETNLIGSVNSEPIDRRYILQLLEACSATRSDVIKFLDDWWDNADKSLPNFPQNKQDFITQTNVNTSVQFDVDTFVNNFLIDANVYNKYIKDIVFLPISVWDNTTYNKYKEIFDNSYLGTYFSDPSSAGLEVLLDSNPPLGPSFPIKMSYPNGQVYSFFGADKPVSNGNAALNSMRLEFYNFFQRNPTTRGLDLSVYLSSNNQITNIVNIVP